MIGNFASLELIKAKSISEAEVKRTVDLILESIKAYVYNPLLKHAKTKSMSNKKNNFIIIKEEDRIIAFTMYRVEKELSFIYEIHVDAEYRSKMLGTALISEIIKDQPGQHLILFVHKPNTRAQSFYKRFGFNFDHEYEHIYYFKMDKLN